MILATLKAAQRHSTPSTRQHATFVGALLLITVAVRYVFYTPALYQDDWWEMVWMPLSGNLPAISLARRPLLFLPRWVVYQAYGLNVHAFYAVLVVLDLLVAIEIYYLATKALRGNRAFGFALAALVSVYPVIYTNMWLSTIHIKLALVLTLLFVAALRNYLDTSKWPVLAFGLVALLASFLMYEAQLGIAVAATILLALVPSAPRARRAVMALGVGATSALFVFYRTVGLALIGVEDEYLAEATIQPSVVVDRLFLGLKVLVWGWCDSIRSVLPVDSSILALAVIGLVVAITGFAGWWFLRCRRVSANSAFQQERRSADIREALLMATVGLVFAVAGYLPVAALYIPNLSSVVSRVNCFAVLGASLAIVSMLWIVSLLLGRSPRGAAAILLCCMAPLLALGCATQALVQRDNALAWQEQRLILNELTQLCPNLADGAGVYFVLPGYQDRSGFRNWKRVPLAEEWEVTGAIRVLYGNNSLLGGVFLPDIPRSTGEPILQAKGITSSWNGEATSYEDAVFLSYDGMPRRLRLVDTADVKSLVHAFPPISTRINDSCLKQAPPPDSRWRSLIALSGDP